MLAPSLQRIVQVIEEENAHSWAEIQAQLSNVELSGSHRRFLVTRMGSTGSTWLAKLLNSHPDVFCTHEQVLARVHARRSFGTTDIVELIRAIASNTHHGAYQAAGDIGSIWLGHARALRGRFTTALLLRHPARLLYTRLKIYPVDQSFTAIEPSTSARRLWDIDLDRLDMLDRVFVSDLYTFAFQAWALDKIDVIIRVEDLIDPEYCGEILEHLTGVYYEHRLIAGALSTRVNRRTSPDRLTIRQIVEHFTPRQREWYERLLGDVAPYLGYDLETDVTKVIPISQAQTAARTIK